MSANTHADSIDVLWDFDRITHEITEGAIHNHGDPAARVELGLDDARAVLDSLPAFGVDLNKITEQLEDEGVKKFDAPFDKLLKSLELKREKFC